MRKIAFVFTVTLSWVNGIFAQPFWQLANDSATGQVAVYSHFEGNSNRMPNTMQKYLLWGGFMGHNLLDNVHGKLEQEANRFGFEFANQAHVTWKRKNHYWVAGAKYRELMGLQFTKDFFGLLFLGNAAYESRNATLSPSHFLYTQYSGASFGYSLGLNQGKSGQLYVALSGIYGMKHQSLAIKQATLYTAPEGEYLTLQASDVWLRYADESYGVGAGFDLGYALKTGKHEVQLLLQDLGFVHWQEMNTTKANATERFSGISVNNANQNNLFTDLSGNALLGQFGLEESKEKYTNWLPYSVAVKYKRNWSEKWATSLDVYYTKIPAYIPRASTRMERHLFDKWQVHAGLGYGGFGRENLLFGFRKNFARQWSFEWDGYFLGMVVAQQTSYGLGLNFGLRKGF